MKNRAEDYSKEGERERDIMRYEDSLSFLGLVVMHPYFIN
jgi:hypothetical protein